MAQSAQVDLASAADDADGTDERGALRAADGAFGK